MNVRFHHERIRTYLLDRIGMNFVTLSNEQAADLIDRLRSQLAHVIANRAPLEFGVFVPRTDAHDAPQLDVILRQILQLVVRIIASQPHTGEYQNVPECASNPSLREPVSPKFVR